MCTKQINAGAGIAPARYFAATSRHLPSNTLTIAHNFIIFRMLIRSLTSTVAFSASQPYGGETASTGTKKRWLHTECSSARKLDGN
jgi:hypothetical protein